MRIGIDISQVMYKNSGVANYLTHLIGNLLKIDNKNSYVFFFSSLRGKLPLEFEEKLTEFPNVTIKKFKIPLSFLDILWNKIHIIPIEYLIGSVDVFISSDWVEPPVRKAKKCTILYDLVVYTHPKETDKKIEETQKRKLSWVRKETDKIFCISQSTINDAEKYLGIDRKRLEVLYPGVL